MRNLWNDAETPNMDELDLLVYQSRLIGADPSLVVWGGGNTSIKVDQEDFRGRDTRTMIIKGSGSDLKTIERRHFPGLRLEDILPLFERDSMSDEDMVDYLNKCMLDPSGPRPSIETLLHAFLPYKSVAHSHADSVVALTNNGDAQQVLHAVYGDYVAVIEYIRPGFILSKKVGEAVRGNPHIKGVVLVNHGLFTWGGSTKAAYDVHIDLVTLAEEYAQKQAAGKTVFGGLGQKPLDTERRRQVVTAVAPTLRGLVSRRNRVVLRYDDSQDVLEFVGSRRGRELSSIGPATPDHLLQTKQKPLWVDVDDAEDVPALLGSLRQGVERYAEEYSEWYRRHNTGGEPMLDPYPRVVLVPGVGMWTTGRDSRGALITGDIYHHTIGVIGSAQSVSEYTSLTARDAYEAEYWPLELYKLTLAPPERSLARRVALVTGGANGIGRTIALRLAAEGAHLVVTDVDQEGAQAVSEEVNKSHGQGRAIACRMDVTSEREVADAFRQTRMTYGGLDILVSNAGIAPVGAIDQLSLADWQLALDINTTGHFLVAREAVRTMREQSLGGSLVFIGTKNVTSPGRDFGAYSASKAAEVQLVRVLAIENGEYGIRCNVVNPDAIFQGSNLWSKEVREQRAQAHGISVDDLEDFYRGRNLLKERISADDVAETVLFLASDRSSKTTGAMIPVDGGLRDAFPR
jgi:rhamnulose-1-phosphate aldolase/alcohol dehydrogenase